MHGPSLLILDEPTVGLDPEHRAALWHFLDALRREQGTAVLFSTHYLAEAEGADAVVLLSGGKVVDRGSPAALMQPFGSSLLEVEGPGVSALVTALQERSLAGVVVRAPGGCRIALGAHRDQALELAGTVPGITRALLRRPSLEDVYFARTECERLARSVGMIALYAIAGIVQRDLRRAARQPSRLIGGLARPFVWLLLVASGYNAIANPGTGGSYRAFVFPGVIIMACLFGSALTAVSTVYDREFGMLRLMLASPAGAAVVLAGRAVSATAVGLLQGLVVLAAAPLVMNITLRQAAAGRARHPRRFAGVGAARACWWRLGSGRWRTSRASSTCCSSPCCSSAARCTRPAGSRRCCGGSRG